MQRLSVAQIRTCHPKSESSASAPCSPASWRAAAAKCLTGLEHSHMPARMVTMRSARPSHSCNERDDNAKRADLMPAARSRHAGLSSFLDSRTDCHPEPQLIQPKISALHPRVYGRETLMRKAHVAGTWTRTCATLATDEISFLVPPFGTRLNSRVLSSHASGLRSKSNPQVSGSTCLKQLKP